LIFRFNCFIISKLMISDLICRERIRIFMIKSGIFRPVILAACAIMVLLSACGNTTVVDSDVSTDASATKATSTTGTTKPPMDTNPLTGIADIKPGEGTRPVAIMIGNNDKSRPQLGIEKADAYFEAETEGGITRIMAVFSGASRIPDKLGPIRSARTPFIKIAESIGAIYCHAGGSSTGLDLLKTADVNSINALNGSSSSAFWRDATLRNTKGQEYSLLTSGSKLSAKINSLKLSASPTKPSPFNFNNSVKGSGLGQKVQIHMSGAQTVSFTYDSETGLYLKSNGTLEKGVPHKSESGVTLSAANVIIMYDEKYSENERTIGFRLISGTGVLVSGGTSRQIRWNRTKDRLQFTEADGTTLNLATGRCYVCLTDKNNSSKTVLS